MTKPPAQPGSPPRKPERPKDPIDISTESVAGEEDPGAALVSEAAAAPDSSPGPLQPKRGPQRRSGTP